MALRRYVTGQVGQIAPINTNRPENVPSAVGALFGAFNSLIGLLNRGLSMGDASHMSNAGNLDATYVEALTPAVANTEFEIVHGLGRRPVGYDLVRLDRACSVYDSSSGSWTEGTMRLKCDAPSATITLRVY